MSPGGLFSPQFVDAPWSLAKLVDMLGHIWVPIVIVGTSGMAGMMRVMRGNVLDIIGSSHVNVARAKGLREKRVVRKYVVREALNPIITSLGMQLPAIIGGSTIVSIVLGLQTTGPLLLQALRQRDMYLAGSMLVVLSFMLLIGNLLADIVLAWTDPRIQLE
jgi:peptide/nickel transport system permease protein